MAAGRRLDVHVLAYPGIQLPSLDGIDALFPIPVTLRVVPNVLSDIGLDEFGAVTHNQLSQDLIEYLKGVPDPADPWVACVLVAKYLQGEPGVNGVLIDADDSFSAQGYQRAGCAVFIGRTGREWLFRRTVVHELGHVLNLDHADAGAGCVMHTSPGALAEPIKFSSLSVTHLVSHRVDEVRPNGWVFGLVADKHPKREGGIYSRASIRVDLALRGRVRRSDTTTYNYEIGVPPILRTVVRNLDRRRFSLECSARRKLRVWVQYRRPGETWVRLPPMRVACSSAQITLGAGRSVSRAIMLPQRSGGVLTSPGAYELRTIVNVGGRSHASATCRVRALPPSKGRKAVLMRRVLDPSVSRAMERGFVDPTHRARLARLVDALPSGHPVRAGLSLALGRSAAEQALTRGSAEHAVRARRWLARAQRDDEEGIATASASRWLKRLRARSFTRRAPAAPTKRRVQTSGPATQARRRKGRRHR